MFITTLQVALGGAIGAALRFWAGLAVLRLTGPGFPVAVMGVNIVGSFLMGLAVVYLGQKGLSNWQPFVMTGVLGGFTTFSAFSLEAYTLFERGDSGQAAFYVLGSVVLSILGLIAGVMIGRGAFA